MPNVTQWLVSLPKHEIRGPSLKCIQFTWQWELTPPEHFKTQASQDTENVQKEHSHDERHQEPRHSEEEEGKRVDEHLEETDNINVRDGGDELAEFCVACHRTVASTTPDLHSNPWGLVVYSTAVFDIVFMCQALSNSSIASDTYQTHETTDGLQSTKNCKVYPKQLHQTEYHAFTTCSPRVSCMFPTCFHVFTTCFHVCTTCSPRVYHVFTTCSPRVYHVFTTCSLRVHHVFTTCSPRVHHVFTTCSPRVHHVFTTCLPCVHHVRVHHVFSTCRLVW